MFPNHFYDQTACRAWSQTARGGESSSYNQQEETPPSSPSAKADSPQYSPQRYYTPQSQSPQAYGSPAESPPHSYATYEDNSTAPGRGSNRQGGSSTLSRFLRLFQRGEGSSGTKEAGSTSENAGQRRISREKLSAMSAVLTRLSVIITAQTKPA